jgi:hypothetical protein
VNLYGYSQVKIRVEVARTVKVSSSSLFELLTFGHKLHVLNRAHENVSHAAARVKADPLDHELE